MREKESRDKNLDAAFGTILELKCLLRSKQQLKLIFSLTWGMGG
jgi:hypothetical protein